MSAFLSILTIPKDGSDKAKIYFTLIKKEYVKLEVLSSSGKIIFTIFDEFIDSAEYIIPLSSLIQDEELLHFKLQIGNLKISKKFRSTYKYQMQNRPCCRRTISY